MTFAAISQYVLGDEFGQSRWLLEHYMEHQEFVDALAALGQRITALPIQTMADPDIWLEAHQKIHQSIWSSIGGGVSTDLGRLDWKNESQVYNWMGLHAAIHRDIRGTLGL